MNSNPSDPKAQAALQMLMSERWGILKWSYQTYKSSTHLLFKLSIYKGHPVERMLDETICLLLQTFMLNLIPFQTLVTDKNFKVRGLNFF